jgi:outer membrane biosynthesis protein TonB
MEPSSQAAEEAAEKPAAPPKPDDKKPTPDQKPSKPTDFKPVDKVADDEIALTKKETHPKPVTAIEPPTDTPSPVAHAARLRPLEEPMAKLTTPLPKQPQQPPQPPQPRRDTGYQPEQEQNRIEGSISNRGKKSVDAIGTPMGRYRKQVNDAIGSRWYYYIHDRMDLLAFGSVRVSFLIDPKGHVSSVRVDNNTSNQSLADVSINAIRDAEIGPPPLDPASPMSQEPLEWSLTFTYYPFAK